VDELDRLRELERQIEREWWWLNGALHAAAQLRTERIGGALQASERCKSRCETLTSAAQRSHRASQCWQVPRRRDFHCGGLRRTKLWLTYAWKDNEDEQVDYVIQALEEQGLEIGCDRAPDPWTASMAAVGPGDL
jgi:hypothetical protein